ncbi:hypothetical protein LCGC14_2093460, partial [marine sediment metagenome]
MPQLSDFATETEPAVSSGPLPSETKPEPEKTSGTASLSDFAVEAQPSAPSLGERAIAAGQGTVAGVAQAAPLVAGAFAGAKLGAAAGALAGPAYDLRMSQQ